jgi:hypothetical protein
VEPLDFSGKRRSLGVMRRSFLAAALIVSVAVPSALALTPTDQRLAFRAQTQ